jgi:hypothetical protein
VLGEGRDVKSPHQSIAGSLKYIDECVRSGIDDLCARMEKQNRAPASVDLIRYAADCWDVKWMKTTQLPRGSTCAITGQSLEAKQEASTVVLYLNLRKLFIRESTATILRGEAPVEWMAWWDKKKTQINSPNPSADSFVVREDDTVVTSTVALARQFVVKSSMVYPIRLIMAYGLFVDHANPVMLKRTPTESAAVFKKIHDEINAY